MANLLHIDSSVQGDRSVSRALTARAATQWRLAHPGGTVTYRDLGTDPIPHLVTATAGAGHIPTEQRTPAQEEDARLTADLIDEVKRADTIVLGVPLYNFGPPSALKAWVDHIIAAGLSFDPSTGEGLLGGTEVVVLTSRGGGYGPGTPRHGWDHSEAWLRHVLSFVGLTPRIITAEMTMADANPALAHLKPLAEQSLAQAEHQIDELWVPQRVA